MATITVEVPDVLVEQFQIEPTHLAALIREVVTAKSAQARLRGDTEGKMCLQFSQQFPDKNQRHMCWTTGPVKRGPSYYV